jgi:hypothetical protein
MTDKGYVDSVTTKGNTITGKQIYSSNFAQNATIRTLTDKGYVDSVALLKLNVASPAYTGTIKTGTLGYTPANSLATLQTSVNNFSQFVIANTNTGATASSDFVVNNSNSTDATYYGDFGINGSGFTGSGALNQPNNTYLTATTGDLVLGTTTSNAIHFVINGGSTDAATINTNGSSTHNNISSYGGNYGARYTTRTLVDKNYADSAILAHSGVTDVFDTMICYGINVALLPAVDTIFGFTVPLTGKYHVSSTVNVQAVGSCTLPYNTSVGTRYYVNGGATAEISASVTGTFVPAMTLSNAFVNSCSLETSFYMHAGDRLTLVGQLNYTPSHGSINTASFTLIINKIK